MWSMGEAGIDGDRRCPIGHRARRGKPTHTLDHEAATHRASAQVSVEPVLDVVEGRVRVAAQHSVEGHDDAGRAETALAAMQLGEALLDHVHAGAAVPDPLHRRDVARVDGAERGEAGVHGDVLDPLALPVGPAAHRGDHHRAGAAAALTAAQLRAAVAE